MNKEQWIAEAMTLAHYWAQQAYTKALGKGGDIDGARTALRAPLSTVPGPEWSPIKASRTSTCASRPTGCPPQPPRSRGTNMADPTMRKKLEADALRIFVECDGGDLAVVDQAESILRTLAAADEKMPVVTVVHGSSDELDAGREHSLCYRSDAQAAVLAAVAERDAEIERLRGLYNELLFAVSNKHPGESRHATALRYIKRAETTTEGPATAAIKGN